MTTLAALVGPDEGTRIRGYSVNLDVSESETSIEEFFNAIGTVNHLIYTAADSLLIVPISGLTKPVGEKAFGLRYWSLLAAIKHAVPHMPQSASSSIVLTSGNVVFRPIPDDAVRVAALQNGEGDVAVNIPPHMANIINNHPKIYLTTAPSIRTIQLMFYTAQFDAQNKLVGPYQGPTADKRVRQAITLALDADEIIKGVLDGKAQRVATLLPSMHFGYDPSLKPVKQDVAKAKKLLAEAGFPNGLEIQLNSPQGRYVRDKEVAEAAAGQLTKAGIKTTLKTFEFVNYLNNMVYVHKAGPVWLIGWGQGMMDAEGIYVPLFHTGSLLSNYHNPDFDGMVDQAQTMMDEKQRLAQYYRINKLWLDDQPAAPLYQQIDLYGASKRLNWKARSDEAIKAYDMSLK